MHPTCVVAFLAVSLVLATYQLIVLSASYLVSFPGRNVKVYSYPSVSMDFILRFMNLEYASVLSMYKLPTV